MAYGAPHEQYFFVDNWEATLAAAIGTGDVTLSIEGALVDALTTPTPASTRRYLATLEEGATREIVEITGRDTGADTVTVVRARWGTTAAAFGVGAKLQMRPAAGMASLLGIGGINQQGNIFIGAFNAGGALASGAARNILVGNAAANQVTTGDDNVVIGDNAYLTATTGSRNVAVGSNALQSVSGAADNNTAVGHNAGASAGSGASRLTLVGAFTDAAGTRVNGLALGYGATLTADNQGAIGDGNAPITDIYIGEGVDDSTPPALVTLQATGAAGTDVAGAPMRLAGGKGTGTGAGGKVFIATAPAGGGSGSAQNALVDRAEWDATGLLWTYAGLKTGDPGSGAGTWKLGTVVAGAVALDTANYVEVDIGGTVIKLLKAA